VFRHKMFLTSAVVLLLAAGCSAEDGSVETPEEDTAEEPGTTPTPSSPPYDAFPLKGPTSFDTINAELSYSGVPDQAVTLGVVSTEQSSGRLRVVADTAVSNGVFGIDEEGVQTRFSQEEMVGATSPVFEEFRFRRTSQTTLGQYWELNFLNNSLAGVRTSNRELQFDHVSYAIWSRAQSRTGTKRVTMAIWGYPTIPSDVPTQEVVDYSMAVRGRAVGVSRGATTVTALTGTVTASVNFASGQIDVNLDLSGTTDDGERTQFGKFSGIGSYAPGQNQFTGTFTGDSPLKGTIAGGFFGAAGEEMGISFALSGVRNGIDQRIIGATLGKKVPD